MLKIAFEGVSKDSTHCVPVGSDLFSGVFCRLFDDRLFLEGNGPGENRDPQVLGKFDSDVRVWEFDAQRGQLWAGLSNGAIALIRIVF